MIKFAFNNFINNLVSADELKEYENKKQHIQELFNNKEMTGWYDLDNLFRQSVIDDIQDTATYIRNNCDVFLVIGIGGSYLGSKAVIEALNPYFYNQKKKPEIYYVGTSLSSDYYTDLMELIKNKEIIVNIISKSGSTLETDIGYSLVMSLMKNKYSIEELKNRVIITTSNGRGPLWEEAVSNNYKVFTIPDNVGGRYSVFSPAGLLPIAVSGIDVSKFYEGTKEANKNIENQMMYAFIRDIMHKKGKTVELYIAYEPKLESLTEWLEQLYAESLGKNGKGIFPVSSINTRDLHSLGQFIQEGNRILFETVINVENSNSNIHIEKYNKSLTEINNLAVQATSLAHSKADVLENIITLDYLNEYNIGYLLQFFMISCAISGYLLNVNPFDQNGVEEYKKNLKELLH